MVGLNGSVFDDLVLNLGATTEYIRKGGGYSFLSAFSLFLMHFSINIIAELSLGILNTMTHFYME